MSAAICAWRITMPNKIATDAETALRQREYELARQYLRRLTESLSDAAVDVAWTQWSAMGTTAASKRKAHSIIDPEALVLMTLFIADHEPRLLDLVHDWVSAHAGLLSTQRIRNLASAYPDVVQHRLADVARTAIERGKDARWKTLVGSPGEPISLTPRTNKHRATLPDLGNPALLLLRLRLAFGAGIKADALGFLLGKEGAGESVRAAALATGYTQSALRRAADEMVMARVLRSTDGPPAQYRADQASWSTMLGLNEMPRWRDWNVRFQIIAALLAFAMKVNGKSLTLYALSAMLRDLAETHKVAFAQSQLFTWNRPSVPQEWALVLERDLQRLGKAMKAEV